MPNSAPHVHWTRSTASTSGLLGERLDEEPEALLALGADSRHSERPQPLEPAPQRLLGEEHPLGILAVVGEAGESGDGAVVVLPDGEREAERVEDLPVELEEQPGAAE